MKPRHSDALGKVGHVDLPIRLRATYETRWKSSVVAG